jgi:hypothetical protein
VIGPGVVPRRRDLAARAGALGAALAVMGCGGSLDAGWNTPKGKLPVDNRNPIVICNDGPTDNWQGEYAMLFANSGGPPLAGILVDSSRFWPDLQDNLTKWQQMVEAARQAGLQNIPDPVPSDSAPLVRPSDGNIDSTVPNNSGGARFIVEKSREVSYWPLVVVTGGKTTDVADAYLLDPTVPDRVVVASWLGSTTNGGAVMGSPNGELDPWADAIVAQKFRYIQVSASYDQSTDLPSSALAELPSNPFTAWVRKKQPDVWPPGIDADQVAVIAVAIPSFASVVTRMAQDGSDSGDVPLLSGNPKGSTWLVTEVTRALAPARFSWMLLDPDTYGPH